jgi:hypothetical protein
MNKRISARCAAEMDVVRIEAIYTDPDQCVARMIIAADHTSNMLQYAIRSNNAEREAGRRLASALKSRMMQKHARDDGRGWAVVRILP